jgi:general secretion pathway protein G
MIGVALVVILAAVAIPSYKSYIERCDSTKAIAMLEVMTIAIEDYRLTNHVYPSSLDLVGYDSTLDPWDVPFRYLWIEDNPDGSIITKQRKNRWDNPVNTDFDLYSMGPDGQSQLPFTDVQARDDIVRAYDGTYFGSVSDL